MTPHPRMPTIVLAATLASLVGGRWIVESASARAVWGLDFARYLDPGMRAGPWLLALLLAVLAGIHAVGSAIERWTRRLRRLPVAVYALAAVAGATLCLTFPDRTFFTGDFVLRRSAVAGISDFDRLFPQAMPLDRLVHLTLPRAMQSWIGGSIDVIAVAGGALRAALFVALAVALARALGARGLAALAAVTTVAGTGALALFTGYDKAFADLAVVTLAFGLAGVSEITSNRPTWWSGLLLVAAVALHRSGLALLPAWILLAWWVRPREIHRDPRSWPWARTMPAAGVTALLPLAWRASKAIDVQHLAPSGFGTALAEMVAPERLFEIGNRFVFLVPLVPLLAVAISLVRPERGDRVMRWLIVLAAAGVLPSLLVHPLQGEFRDWDVFAAFGVALSLPLAALLARSVAGAPAWLALMVAAVALVPRIQWLALQASPRHSLARIESWAETRPSRENPSVAAAFEYIAMIQYRDGRLTDGRRAMAAAMARVPSARYQIEWATAESLKGEWSRALPLFERAVELAPNDPGMWIVFGQAAIRSGDRPTLERVVQSLRAIDPGNLRLHEMEARLMELPLRSQPSSEAR